MKVYLFDINMYLIRRALSVKSEVNIHDILDA